MGFDFSNIINAISELFNSISSFLDNSSKRLVAISAIIAIGSFVCRLIYKRLKTTLELKTWRASHQIDIEAIRNDDSDTCCNRSRNALLDGRVMIP